MLCVWEGSAGCVVVGRREGRRVCIAGGRREGRRVWVAGGFGASNRSPTPNTLPVR